MHTLLLDPFYSRNFYKYDVRGKNKFYGSQEEKELLKYRVAYSLMIYLILLRGFICYFFTIEMY